MSGHSYLGLQSFSILLDDWLQIPTIKAASHCESYHLQLFLWLTLILVELEGE